MPSSTDVAIHLQNVTKTFRLPHERNNSIKGAIVNFTGRKKGYETQTVLQGISLDIKKGEFFGIVGRNGSGKSTLLKLLAGIYTPTTGSIQITGKLTPFIELGVGFNPELTGRENVFLNGALLGFNRSEMKALYDDIVAFAELERFMDQKLKNYSSGMQVRLAFSIAIRAQTDLLILDEVLAVGDANFQQKCYDYFYDLKREGHTVVLVTHDMGAVNKFCTRAILLDAGKIKAEGRPRDIAKKYEELNLRGAEKNITAENKKGFKPREGNNKVEIVSVGTFDPATGDDKNTFFGSEEIGVRMIGVAHEEVVNPSVGFIFQDAADNTVFATNNHVAHTPTQKIAQGQEIVMECIVDNVFTNGKYTITSAIESESFTEMYDRIEYVHSFLLGGHELPHAFTHPPHKMGIEYREAEKNRQKHD